MSLLSKHIFISKNPEEVIALQKRVNEAGGKLSAQALISFEPLPVQEIPQTEIIFFSSPRGVKFYLDDYTIGSKTICACVGMSTAQELEKRGIKPAFIGQDNLSIEEVAEAFRGFAGDHTVLFPNSNISLGTIASTLPQKQVHRIAIYRTVPQLKTIAPCDIYVFSSPSNVSSFFKENKIDKDSLVIAWGNSTAKALNDVGISSKKLGTPSVECLIEYLENN